MTRKLLAILTVLWLSDSISSAAARESAGAVEGDPESALFDAQFSQACGPIASYAALRWVGIDTTLAEVAHESGYRVGTLTSVSALCEAMKSFGATVTPEHLDASQLREIFRARERVAVLLIVRKDSQDLNHAFTIVGTKDTQFLIIDYPTPLAVLGDSDLDDIWDGDALVVRNKLAVSSSLAEVETIRPIKKCAAACLFVGGIGVLLFSIARMRQKHFSYLVSQPHDLGGPKCG